MLYLQVSRTMLHHIMYLPIFHGSVQIDVPFSYFERLSSDASSTVQPNEIRANDEIL